MGGARVTKTIYGYFLCTRRHQLKFPFSYLISLMIVGHIPVSLWKAPLQEVLAYRTLLPLSKRLVSISTFTISTHAPPLTVIVEVRFYPCFKFYFPLFQTYHELPYPKTKDNKIQTRHKSELQRIPHPVLRMFYS